MAQAVITPTCRTCKTDYLLKVNAEDIKKINQGVHVQNAMPYLSAGERELLISGICDTCFNKMFDDAFSEDDEEDE
jgi:hypothetical protein